MRLGRPGVEIAGAYVSWADLGSLAVTKGRLGHGPQFTVTRTDGYQAARELMAADQPPTIVFTPEGATPAAGAARTPAKPANEPLPAIIGGRVIAGTTGDTHLPSM